MASVAFYAPHLPSLSSSSSATLTARCHLRSPLPLRRTSLHRRRFRCCSYSYNKDNNKSNKKNGTGFMDQILDYIEGGPKLRRWYGGSPGLLPRDAAVADDERRREDSSSPGEEDANEVRDAVLVTNGDSEIGQMVILSLILKRAQIKAIVKDKRAAIDAFGTYVEPVAADSSGKLPFIKALTGVRAIISPSNEGFLSNVGQMKGIQHIVLLSQDEGLYVSQVFLNAPAIYFRDGHVRTSHPKKIGQYSLFHVLVRLQLAAYRGSSGIQALVNAKARKLAEADEKTVITSGIPYTIIRSGFLQDSPGGKEGFSFKEGVAAKGKLSKEDAALICVEALDVIPRTGLILEVANGEEQISDWKQWFVSLVKNKG